MGTIVTDINVGGIKSVGTVVISTVGSSVGEGVVPLNDGSKAGWNDSSTDGSTVGSAVIEISVGGINIVGKIIISVVGSALGPEVFSTYDGSFVGFDRGSSDGSFVGSIVIENIVGGRNNGGATSEVGSLVGRAVVLVSKLGTGEG